jgi:hypothetical protein
MSPSVLIMRVTSKVGSRAVGGHARDARLLPGVAATQRHATAAATTLHRAPEPVALITFVDHGDRAA